jgi:cAMP-dependent protein kinase regulator
MEANFMFNTLNPKDKKAIIDAVLLVSKNAGDVIIKEGDDGDNFYLVEDGILGCSKFLKPEDDKETFLREY